MTPVCSVFDIPDGEARTFDFPNESNRTFFILHWGDRFYAYLNRCPHTGIALEHQENQFLSWDKGHIQCAMHGALFNIGNGRCIWGPCRGQSLQSLPLQIVDDQIFVDLTT